MKFPPHPGQQIKAALDAYGLTVSHVATHLGVSRNTLSRVINELAGISPDMAIRLDKALGGGAEIWVRMQASYDLAQAQQSENQIHVRRLKFA